MNLCLDPVVGPAGRGASPREARSVFGVRAFLPRLSSGSVAWAEVFSFFRPGTPSGARGFSSTLTVSTTRPVRGSAAGAPHGQP